ncbi:MAG: zinc metallopeptidase [Clostridia bacterium]|nr:zinc metallopeptidase [Clostridia bacterium]
MYFTFYSDPLSVFLYFVALAIMVASLVIQAKVKSTFETYNRVANRRGLTGAQAAQIVLEANGVTNCPISQTPGMLSDHFDPKANCIRLSESVYGSASVAAVGVAAHEAGHAVQYAKGYAPIKLRGAILPTVQFASGAAFPLVLLGFFLSIQPLVYFGILLYAAITLFQLITLPVELNASRRAMEAIRSRQILGDDEAQGAKRVLTVAALTYVAALAASALQLLRLLVMANNRRR